MCKGIFLKIYIHVRILWSFRRYNSQKCAGCSMTGSPRSSESLVIVHSEPLAFHQLQLSFLCLGTGSHGCFCLWVSAPVSRDPLCSLQVFLIWGAAIYSGIFIYGCKKSCSFLSSAFYLLGWNSDFRSLHARLKLWFNFSLHFFLLSNNVLL